MTSVEPCIHIHRPAFFDWRKIAVCRRCKAVRDHLVTSFVWYESIFVCCECGAYSDDRGMRRKRKRDVRVAENARRRWAAAGDVDDFRAWLKESLS